VKLWPAFILVGAAKVILPVKVAFKTVDKALFGVNVPEIEPTLVTISSTPGIFIVATLDVFATITPLPVKFSPIVATVTFVPSR
jgi:hypothetical protein